ncbi:hypothetical protein Tco_0578647 [Tanacetum coccineum]
MAECAPGSTEGYVDAIVVPESASSSTFSCDQATGIREQVQSSSLPKPMPFVAKVSTSASTSGVSPDVAELKDMVRALLLDKQTSPVPAPAPVKAVEQSCVTCGGAHSYRNCPATDRGNSKTYYPQKDDLLALKIHGNFSGISIRAELRGIGSPATCLVCSDVVRKLLNKQRQNLWELTKSPRKGNQMLKRLLKTPNFALKYWEISHFMVKVRDGMSHLKFCAMQVKADFALGAVLGHILKGENFFDGFAPSRSSTLMVVVTEGAENLAVIIYPGLENPHEI